MKILALALLSLAAFTCHAQQALSERDIHKIENGLVPRILVQGEDTQTYNVLERMKLFNVPGLSLAVFKDGKVVWQKGYGLADVKGRVPVDIHTKFQSASISKSVTAFAVLKLSLEKGLDLDRDVNDYLTGWKVPENTFTQSEKVTIRRLLNHTAGLNGEGFPGYDKSDKIPDAVGVLNGEGNSPKLAVEAIPGTRYSYSGAGYVVLQKLVEELSGKSFERYMQDEVLTPLKMSDSSFNPYPSSHMSLAYDFRGQAYAGGWHVYPELAPAGLWTTPADLAKFCVAVRDSLRGVEGSYLPKAMAEQMRTASMKPGGGDEYGLGLEFRGKGINASFGHGGSNAGFKSEMFYFFNQDLGLVLMTNADNGRLARNEMIRALSNHYHLDLFPPKTVTAVRLAKADLDAYAGKYQHEQEKNRYFTVAVDSASGLTMQDLTSGKKNTFIPIGTDKFVDRYSGEEAVFTRNSASGSTRMLYDGDDTLIKVSE
ncbi:serine hydrolase domain-containing protein [Dyella tabacisoli]|uniref:serine hydrolase domain-containing protein n=1 Tax=Dyella tabacisoli TaxID=2282381 RepID=UPI0013B4382E|nr:serine hydrolase domain-containing protein [Dyella tabacisoli]